MSPIRRFCTLLVAIIGFTVVSSVQAQPNRAGNAVITETSGSSDTIGERAAWNLEQQRLKNSAGPVPVAAPIGVIPNSAPNQQRQGAAPEFAFTGIRGFIESLEGSFLINGKRAVGSSKYPTLVDGWKLAEITYAGAVLERNRERKQLPFSGSSPYQDKPAAALATTAPNPNILPFGGLGFPTPMMAPQSGGLTPIAPGAVPMVPSSAIPASR